MTENSIHFIDGRQARDDMEACWEADLGDGEERPRKFVCRACGEAKPFEEVSLTMVVDARMRCAICRACHTSFDPPSLTRRLFGQ